MSPSMRIYGKNSEGEDVVFDHNEPDLEIIVTKDGVVADTAGEKTTYSFEFNELAVIT